MSERAFLLPDAKQRTTETIRAVESQTAAEVVVAVRRAAARHLATSLGFGGALAALSLVVMLVSPRRYDLRTMPLDALLAFVLGAALCHFTPALKRLLTPKARRLAAAKQTARAVFRELGIQKTRARTGVLVYVALFERTTVLVADDGVPVGLLGAPYEAARSALAESVATGSVDAFLSALAELGPVLSQVLPRRPDDENELCDEVA